MKRARCLIVVFFCLLGHLTNAQEALKDIVASFNEYVTNNPVEKIYLHLDKPYYAAGEYMYFRAYLTDIHISQENVVSNIIYVELSDERKKIVKRILLYSEENEFAGQIQLPDSLPSANYHLRAYTNWMRNAGEDYFYHRDIYIGHPTDSKDIKQKAFDYQVDFFPEGGHLLYGMPNSVAFKALGNDGFGIQLSGSLVDETGTKIMQFNSLHGGMGKFEFVPEQNTSYKAIVEYGGTVKEFSLPSAIEGTILSATQSEDSVFLIIKSNSSVEEKLSIIGQSRHTVCYAVEGLRKESDYKIAVSKEDFPTGIAQFTLLKEGQPVSERLLFIDKKDDLQVTITPDKDKYGDREKVILDIKVTDKDGNPVKGSFSLAVTDDKVVTPSINTHNIKGSLLLDSDLKGFIEDPGWYFVDDDEGRKEALDILLSTQGWTRYTWEEAANPKDKVYYPVESEFQITGKMVNLAGKPLKDGEVILFSNANYMGIAQTDKDGRFGFLGFNCPDTATFLLQGRNKRGQRTLLDIILDPINTREILSVNPLTKIERKTTPVVSNQYMEQASFQKKVEESVWTINLDNVDVVAAKNQQEEKIKMFQGMTGYTIQRNQIDDFREMSSALTKIPNGLRLIKDRPLMPIPPTYKDPFNILIVDGMEEDFNELWFYYWKLPGYMFESIEVVEGAGKSLYGARGGDKWNRERHIVILKMRKPQDIAEMFDTPTPGLAHYKPEGYCVQKEFYIPAYDNPEVKQNPTPDLRTTIYWNPVIQTNSYGETELEFYTADNVTTYSYVLEGIGNNQIVSRMHLIHEKY